MLPQLAEGVPLTRRCAFLRYADAVEDRHKLLETLRKIEALYAGAATPGERDAAAGARERIRARLKSFAEQERAQEYRFSMDNPWSRKIFVAPYRYSRQRRNTVGAGSPGARMTNAGVGAGRKARPCF